MTAQADSPVRAGEAGDSIVLPAACADQLAIFPVREGLCPHCGTVPPIWTPAAIIEAARYFHERYGRVPGKTDWRAAGTTNPSAHTVYRVFGGFPTMLGAAGLTPATSGRRVYWTPERIAEAMLDFVAREGRWPRIVDWKKATERNPHYMTVVLVCGSFVKGKIAAGWAQGLSSSPKPCSGCGTSMDNYTVGCPQCQNRNHSRVRREAVAA